MQSKFPRSRISLGVIVEIADSPELWVTILGSIGAAISLGNPNTVCMGEMHRDCHTVSTCAVCANPFFVLS